MERLGQSEGLTPRPPCTSSAVRQIRGIGFSGSASVAPATTTASTRPAARNCEARVVVTPVHCAPSTAGTALARTMFKKTPKCAWPPCFETGEKERGRGRRVRGQGRGAAELAGVGNRCDLVQVVGVIRPRSSVHALLHFLRPAHPVSKKRTGVDDVGHEGRVAGGEGGGRGVAVGSCGDGETVVLVGTVAYQRPQFEQWSLRSLAWCEDQERLVNGT
mmetsp:Transcript_44796/g.122332  ORF Transcript_44796/g.122332 Transcript_44796/m.122332 type:complete len:218 (-) Transcript_44796:211-864(-)